MDKSTEFVVKYGLYVFAGVAVLVLVAFFFLKPENLVPEKCEIDGFSCSSIDLSAGTSSFTLSLENQLGKPLMLKDVSVKGSKVSCFVELDDGWGPFVKGRHLEPGSSTKVVLPCSGLDKSMVGSGNVELRAEASWFFDDLSEASSKTSDGVIFAEVSS